MNNYDLRWKYRPRFFSEVIGNQRTIRKLTNIITTRELPKGLVLHGEPGSGKTTLAHLFAKALHCQNFDQDLCGKCKNCLSLKDHFSGGLNYEVYDCSRFGSGELEKILHLLGFVPCWNPLGINICIFDEFHRCREPLQERLLQMVEFGRKTLFIFCLIDFSKITEAFRQRVEILKTRAPEISDLIPWLRRICDSEGIILTASEVLIQVAIEANRLPRECLALLQSAKNLNEPLTQDLIREIARDRQGYSDDGLEHGLAEEI